MPSNIKEGSFVAYKPQGRGSKLDADPIVYKVVTIGTVETDREGQILIIDSSPQPKRWWVQTARIGLLDLDLEGPED